MMDLATLKQMKSVDINNIDPSTVTEAKNINIDISLPVQERMAEYMRQSVNPYFIKVGKVIVKMGYADTNDTANDCFERYMRTC